MSMMARGKREKIGTGVTPITRTGWTCLNKPNDNVFEVVLNFEGEEAAIMMEQIEALLEKDGRDNIKVTGFKDLSDENPGSFSIRFKQTAGGTRQDGSVWQCNGDGTIPLLDSELNRVSETVTRGSRVRVSYVASKTEFKGQNYLNLGLGKVQVIELGTGGAEFDAVDGGFTSSGSVTTEVTDVPREASSVVAEVDF